MRTVYLRKYSSFLHKNIRNIKSHFVFHYVPQETCLQLAENAAVVIKQAIFLGMPAFCCRQKS